ncbi:Hypothetical protein TART1_0653 [Trichococcus shcherbakoviae]|uniref:Uncharacterized protein n=1 Tax=Trichococcus shcherbakoviae TaxID=2094020 RepID=A0A383TC69_9LACT|nr:Hypothetical protein TART1_0653 [Trichococcus shcherbakoviae]
MRRALTGGKHQLLPGTPSPERRRAQSSHLRLGLACRRTACDSALSSRQHSLAGGKQITGTATPLRRALTGGKHQLLSGTPSPELRRAQIAHLRRALVRRRTASDSALSSGQQPVTGGEQITGTATPLRRALTGGKHQLRSELASPEQVRAQNAHLRRTLARRRTGSDSAPSSGQQPVTGGKKITDTPPPTRALLVGGGRRPPGLCKSFLTFSTHFPLQIIPTGVLLSAYN